MFLLQTTKVMQEQILKVVSDLGLQIENNFVKLFHGTSKKNQTSILKSKKFKGYPWFAPDAKTAMNYALATGGRPVIMEVWVCIDVLYYNGYFTVARPIKQIASTNQYEAQ